MPCARWRSAGVSRPSRGAGRCPAASYRADEDLSQAAARELAEETGAVRPTTPRPRPRTTERIWSSSPPTATPAGPAHARGQRRASRARAGPARAARRRRRQQRAGPRSRNCSSRAATAVTANPWRRSPSITPRSSPTEWNAPAPRSSTRRWPLPSARPSSPSGSCAGCGRCGASHSTPRNFHRKVTGTPGFLVPTGGTTTRQGGRPAQLFRAGGATPAQPADAAPRGLTDGPPGGRRADRPC